MWLWLRKGGISQTPVRPRKKHTSLCCRACLPPCVAILSMGKSSSSPSLNAEAKQLPSLTHAPYGTSSQNTAPMWYIWQDIKLTLLFISEAFTLCHWLFHLSSLLWEPIKSLILCVIAFSSRWWQFINWNIQATTNSSLKWAKISHFRTFLLYSIVLCTHLLYPFVIPFSLIPLHWTLHWDSHHVLNLYPFPVARRHTTHIIGPRTAYWQTVIEALYAN